ncbi:hypothetical protein EV360DRAFT_49816, partial [Lentinula raphanica]
MLTEADYVSANRDDNYSGFTPEGAIESATPECLKTDQRRAFDIVEWHLQQTLMGRTPPPLRMIIHGEGGTGKSKVIATITDMFRKKKVLEMLIKSAYTGVAASLIEGNTTHSIAAISTQRRN